MIKRLWNIKYILIGSIQCLLLLHWNKKETDLHSYDNYGMLVNFTINYMNNWMLLYSQQEILFLAAIFFVKRFYKSLIQTFLKLIKKISQLLLQLAKIYRNCNTKCQLQTESKIRIMSQNQKYSNLPTPIRWVLTLSSGQLSTIVFLSFPGVCHFKIKCTVRIGKCRENKREFIDESN
jgi:hypothetical protein